MFEVLILAMSRVTLISYADLQAILLTDVYDLKNAYRSPLLQERSSFRFFRRS